jgi:SAM-dependent methyltransferase
MEKECYGKALDIGGGTIQASHYRFLRITKWFRLTTLDISPAAKPDIVIDLEKEGIPFKDNVFDFVLAFNIVEHLSRREEVLREVYRVLKPGGELIGIIPFLVNVHPDPNDYIRLTDQGLVSLFTDIGFRECSVKPVGFGPFTAGYYQVEFILPRVLRLLIAPIAILLDKILCTLRPRAGYEAKFPLSYAFYIKK